MKLTYPPKPQTLSPYKSQAGQDNDRGFWIAVSNVSLVSNGLTSSGVQIQGLSVWVLGLWGLPRRLGSKRPMNQYFQNIYHKRSYQHFHLRVVGQSSLWTKQPKPCPTPLNGRPDEPLIQVRPYPVRKPEQVLPQMSKSPNS